MSQYAVSSMQKPETRNPKHETTNYTNYTKLVKLFISVIRVISGSKIRN